MSFPEFVQWVEFYHLENEEQKNAIKGKQSMSWDQLKFNMSKHNEIVRAKDAVKR